VVIPKYPDNPDDISLSVALQYGMATGLVPLQKIIKEFSGKVFQPAYENFTTLVHTGNTDAWSKAVLTLCNPGEGVLASEWTYPSAMASMKPYGITPVPVAMDSQGMRSDALRTVLAEWDQDARGMARPHVLYTVPVGQNPTGATMATARKKEIYEVCVEFDIIIVEDDPYYFLQEGPYVPKASRKRETPLDRLSEEERYVASLAPSFLKFDYQGRVIRLDTFSKTIAPGCRLGWFTCNPMFAERLERQGETTTQAPCGFGQSMVTAILLNWKYDGYIRWLRGLGVQYTQRRDFLVDCLADEFHLQILPGTSGVWSDCDVYGASLKPKRGIFSEKSNPTARTLFSFVPPTAGMFVWLKLHFEHHPAFTTLGYKALEMKLWTELAEAGVLFGFGAMFSAAPVDDNTKGPGHFRISFSNLEFDEMKRAVSIFGSVLRDFMADV